MEHPGLVETILDRGHEIGHHGLDHTGEYGATFQEQRERIERCQEIFEKYTGRRALGFRPTGALLPETERWIYSEGGFVYSSAGVSLRLVRGGGGTHQGGKYPLPGRANG